MAPEMMTGNATTLSDMYSFGLVTFDLHFEPKSNENGRVYRRKPLYELLSANEDVHIPQYDNDDVNDALNDLLKRLLVIEILN